MVIRIQYFYFVLLIGTPCALLGAEPIAMSLHDHTFVAQDNRSENSSANRSIIDLPMTVGPWSRPEAPETVTAKTIFDYMDGAGELYVGYRFRKLDVFEYTSAEQNNILVELYWMETSGDAFGLLSQDWRGDPVVLRDEIVADATPAPAARALYGSGLLRIASDDLYARVMANVETPASKEAVLALGRAIMAHRPLSSPPDLVKLFPASFDEKWKLLGGRLFYFRSHLALNSAYFISTHNILDLDHSTEAAIVPYENQSGAEKKDRIQLLLIRYLNAERTQQGLKHFREAFLPEHRLKTEPVSSAGRPFIYQIEEGWMGYRTSGNMAVLVFGSPTQQLVEKAFTQIDKIIHAKEDKHGK
ncbi:MAG: DUF6599 family protein [Candidatus Omnitrophota bacterium]